jgi:hypothetical protein
MIKVLVLGCNHDQIPYLKELKDKYYLIGSDLNPNAPGKIFCDKFYNVGYDNFKGLTDIGKKEKFNSKDKVFTASAQFAHLGCANFALAFDIPYPNLESIEICLDKAKFYNLFKSLQVPIPETHYITNLNELKNKILEIGDNKDYYLKSDFSKNPNYVYKLKLETIKSLNIFWGRDRFLRNHYILQEEFIGEHLRINLIKDDFILFPIKYGDILKTTKDEIVKRGIINKLNLISNNLGITNWIVKFDIVLGLDDYVVLDIGLDPPFRLNKLYNDNSLNLAKCYIELCLNNNSIFNLLDYEN